MLLSVVVPLFNEEAVLPTLIARLDAVLNSLACDSEVLLVNDGSSDRTLELAIGAARVNPGRYRVLSLARNFGHQAALTAGLDFVQGDATLVMDGDLQDPPELLHEMLARYTDGFDVVSAKRVRRPGEALWKRVCTSAFYWFMQRAVDPRVIPEVGDFRLLSRTAIDALRRFREEYRFVRGLIAWLGLKEAIVPYDRSPRAAGDTKYPFFKLLSLSWTAVTSFSALPLRLTLLAGIALSTLGGLYLCYAAYQTIVVQSTVRGWATLVFLQVFFSGATLIAIGLIGEYLARVYDESKRRPLYVLQKTVNTPPLPACGLERVLVLSARESSLAEELQPRS